MRWVGSSTRGRAPIEGRLCARPGCAGEAGATMTYDYGRRTAWVDDLAEVPTPAGYDLCGAHARGFSVPQGWTRSDRRAMAVHRVMTADDAAVAAPS